MRRGHTVYVSLRDSEGKQVGDSVFAVMKAPGPIRQRWARLRGRPVTTTNTQPITVGPLPECTIDSAVVYTDSEVIVVRLG